MTATLPSLDQDLRTETAGAKATALARLAAAGLPVPAGVVVPVDHPDDLLPGAVAEILTRCPAPHGLIARSSAVAEDGHSASFAGLFTSRITPAAPSALLDALRAVRASAHHPTVATYGRARGITAHPAMAVLVQAALRPVCSGVLAAEVAEGRCTRWRIEAVRGLAEPLVSGTQTGEIHTGGRGQEAGTRPAVQETIQLPGTPDELDMPPGEWVDLVPDSGTRAKIRTSEAGVLHLHTPAQLAGHPVLAAGARGRLLTTAALAATVLGLDRIDVEWVIDHRAELHLIQARPLTAPLTGRTTGAPTTVDDNLVLHGIAAAPGVVIGPATRADNGTADISGRVLLCRELGPEAVPALLTGPAAVVATTGGELSHTAIITRELGIPCVTNVTNALTAIAPATIVEVDGNTGTVRPTTAVPAQRAAQDALPLAMTAVLTRTLENPLPADGRAATVLWLDPDGPTPDLTPFAAAGPHPVAVLLPGDLPVPATAPPGIRPIRLHGLGTLLWPRGTPPPPAEIAVLGPDGQVLHRRTMTDTAALLGDAQALIVDWDGTVADNTVARHRALQAALAPYGIPVPADRYRALAGLPVRDVIVQLAADLTLPIPPVEEVVAHSRTALLAGPAPLPIACTVDLLRAANALGIPVAVASSAATVLVHDGIQRLGLQALLPVVVTLDDVPCGKPAPDAYLEAARRLGADPARCLAVDDAADGITAALAAGMRTLTIHHGRLVPATAAGVPGGPRAAQP
ncbi:HAD-IA family hydrolase [Kitasatospora brasiliensis]|uniref:HAD-IA family hydrolase n=1 Tax=Kitasatospora brasiliensis TaxID=3058040 RepID=UPI0029301C45|nr:HAD-IA family hydrolase [Kitasatospora sp. K002]